MDGDHLRKAYKDHISDYWEWDQRSHAAHYVLFPQKGLWGYCCVSLSTTIVVGNEAKNQNLSL